MKKLIMKRLLTLGLLAGFLACFTACEDDLFNLGIPFEQSINQEIVIPANVVGIQNCDTTSFNASVNADLQNHLDKLKSFDVEKVILEVTDFQGDLDSAALVKVGLTTALKFGPNLESVIFEISDPAGSENLQSLVNSSPIELEGEEVLSLDNLSEAVERLIAGENLALIFCSEMDNPTSQTYNFTLKITVKLKAVVEIPEDDK